MMSTRDRSVAADLLGLALDEPSALAAFVARHAVAPARRAHGLRDPLPDERDDFLFTEVERSGWRERWMRPVHLEHPAAHFDQLLRGLLLFGHLFPQAVWPPDRPEGLIAHPGVGYIGAAMKLAMRPYAEIAALSAAALGQLVAPPAYHSMMAFRAVPNSEALTEMRTTQALIRRALRVDSDWGEYRRINIGLQAMDQDAASEIDELLRAEVHQRLVWIADFEEADPDNMRSSEWITFDRGVIAARVPETLRGLLLLEFADDLGLGHRILSCSHCGEPLVLSRQRAARAAKGQPVYHSDCHAKHRLAYFRERSASRRAG